MSDTRRYGVQIIRYGPVHDDVLSLDELLDQHSAIVAKFAQLRAKIEKAIGDSAGHEDWCDGGGTCSYCRLEALLND